MLLKFVPVMLIIPSLITTKNKGFILYLSFLFCYRCLIMVNSSYIITAIRYYPIHYKLHIELNTYPFQSWIPTLQTSRKCVFQTG